MSLLLRSWGQDVCAAADGVAALAAMASLSPDVVLMDIGLPGMDGYEIACRCASNLKDADVFLVALTGYGGRQEDRERAWAAGFDYHLTKPILFAETLRQLLSEPPGSTPRGTYMNDNPDLLAKLHKLIQQIESSADPATQSRMREIVQTLMDFHAQAITQMLEQIADSDSAGCNLIDKLAENELISSMLLLYNLHPLDMNARIAQALEKVRPYLHSHGGNVELSQHHRWSRPPALGGKLPWMSLFCRYA